MNDAPKNPQDQKPASDGYYMRLGLRIAAEFGVTIAVPAVASAFLGTYLDRQWGTRPWALVVCLIVAFVLTGVWVVRRARQYKRLYEKPTV